MSSTSLHMVVTTVDSETVAHEIAKTLVREQVAACVQVSGPVTSYYWWEGNLEEGQEWRVILKTSLQPNQVENAIRNIHPYSVPQIIFVSVEASADYAGWVRKVLS